MMGLALGRALLWFVGPIRKRRSEFSIRIADLFHARQGAGLPFRYSMLAPEPFRCRCHSAAEVIKISLCPGNRSGVVLPSVEMIFGFADEHIKPRLIVLELTHEGEKENAEK